MMNHIPTPNSGRHLIRLALAPLFLATTVHAQIPESAKWALRFNASQWNDSSFGQALAEGKAGQSAKWGLQFMEDAFDFDPRTDGEWLIIY